MKANRLAWKTDRLAWQTDRLACQTDRLAWQTDRLAWQADRLACQAERLACQAERPVCKAKRWGWGSQASGLQGQAIGFEAIISSKTVRSTACYCAAMRVIEISKPGGPEVLVVANRPDPVPAPNEVLIRVEAAGVNRPDCLQRLGVYPPPPGASDIPGLEVAGTVEATGPGASRFKKGDRVCALLAGGGYAELCLAPEGQCLPIPKGLSAVEAASLPETVFTVWINVFERAALKPGETFLVQGGSSGIGVTAIQMAKALGASAVFATAGSPEKCAACVKLGATQAIDYKKEDFVEVIRAATKGGVDVILDMVAGSYVARELSCLAEDGRLSIIAVMGGAKAEINVVGMIGRRQTITASSLRPRSVAFKSAVARTCEEKVWPLIEAKKIRPVIDSTFSFDQAAAAHARMEASEHVGKIVLTA